MGEEGREKEKLFLDSMKSRERFARVRTRQYVFHCSPTRPMEWMPHLNECQCSNTNFHLNYGTRQAYRRALLKWFFQNANYRPWYRCLDDIQGCLPDECLEPDSKKKSTPLILRFTLTGYYHHNTSSVQRNTKHKCNQTKIPDTAETRQGKRVGA